MSCSPYRRAQRTTTPCSDGPGTVMQGARMEKEHKPAGTAALRRALAYLRSYKPEAFGAFFALMLVSGANLVTPLLIGRAIDDGTRPGRLEIIFLVVAGLIGVALARGLFQFL